MDSDQKIAELEAEIVKLQARLGWSRVTDGLPVCEAGDRVVCVVEYATHEDSEIRPHIIVLEATEYGWIDESQGGFDIHSVELWMMERDLLPKLPATPPVES